MRPFNFNQFTYRVIAVILFLVPLMGLGQTTVTFTGAATNTTGTWIVPCGVTSFTVRVIGGGGGGGSNSNSILDGSGGGGGGTAIATFTGVSPGTSYNYQGGAFGAGSGSSGIISALAIYQSTPFLLAQM